MPDFVPEYKHHLWQRPGTSDVAEAVGIPVHVAQTVLESLCFQDHLVICGRRYGENTWIART